MTKKSLSDLLKEEASKADTPGGAPAPSVPSDDSATPGAKADNPPIQSRKPATSRAKGSKATGPAKGSGRPTPKPEAKAAQPAVDVQAQTSQTAEAPRGEGAASSQSSTPEQDTKNALIALEAALATAQQEKADLEKIIQGLQEDLAAQQSRLFELTDSLDAAKAEAQASAKARQKAEADLAEAKATIMQLTAPKQPPAPAIVASSTRSARRSGGDIVPRQPMTGPTHPGYVRGVPAAPPQTAQPNPMLSDTDIGWVD